MFQILTFLAWKSKNKACTTNKTKQEDKHINYTRFCTQEEKIDISRKKTDHQKVVGHTSKETKVGETKKHCFNF
jgi:hypothetical protein